jgi:hypothetical protein
MSGKQKVLLVVVAVFLVVLFLVAVAGRDPGQGKPGEHNAFVEWLAKLGGKQGTVPIDLVTPDCPQADRVLTVTGSCTLHVADPKSLKLLVLHSNTAFRVSAPAPGKADLTATDDVKPNDKGVAEARIAVDKPTNITVTCILAIPCTVTVGDE